MSGKTDGRRAYDAWWATAEGVPRHPDVTYDQDAAAWEAAAAASAERIAELVSEVNELRALLGEILGVFWAKPDGHYAWAPQAVITDWRNRAGIDEPAVVTAGTEHLAEKIRGLAIPDEES